MIRAVLLAILFAGCLAPAADLAPAPAPAAPAWAAPEDALIRPGVQLGDLLGMGPLAQRGGCTAAFVFAGADGSAYLSTAAHCMGDEPVAIAGGVAFGTPAYCSFAANGGACSDSGFGGDPHDFGLLLLAPEDVPRTSPEVLALGGPTEVAPCLDLREGDALVMYGNSSFKPDAEPVRAVKGEFVRHDGEFGIRARFLPSAVPADSGSPVLDAEGRAVGVMRALHQDGTNSVVCLEAALEAMRRYGGPDVVLAKP